MEPLIKTEKDITTVLDAMRSRKDHQIKNGTLSFPLRESSAKKIADGFAQLQKWVTTPTNMQQVNWELGFIDTGSLLMMHFQNFDDAEFCKLLLEKHALYGPKPLMKFGPLGVLIRMDSKWERYVNLQNTRLTIAQDPDGDKKEQTHIESIKDTLIDLVGYSVLGYYVAKRIRESVPNVARPN